MARTGDAIAERARTRHGVELDIRPIRPGDKQLIAQAIERLVERAREEGITHFVALVMDENIDAIRLFEHRVPGQARPRRSASGHLELFIELPEPGGLRGSTLARVLRATAHGAVTVNPYRVTRDAIRRLRGD